MLKNKKFDKSKINKAEYELFDSLSAEWWDENGKFKVLHQIRPIRIQYILNQLKDLDLKNTKILDLGCGGGLVSESLSRLGAKVTGIDFVGNNINIAKHHSIKSKLKIDYIHGDIEKIKMNKKFDLIIMFEILEHVNNWKKLLLKIDKNLKKDGKIIISTINRNLISKFTAIYLAESILKWIPKGTHRFEKFIKPKEIEVCLKKNHYALENIKGLEFNPLNYSWMLSENTKVNYFCTFKKN